MANIKQISFQLSSNQKVIVEELIESELEGIVGGDSSEISVVSVVTGTDGSASNTQDSSQQSVKSGDKPYKFTGVREFFKLLDIKALARGKS